MLPVSADGSEGDGTPGHHAGLAVGSQVVRDGFVERQLVPLNHGDIVVAVVSAVAVVTSDTAVATCHAAPGAGEPAPRLLLLPLLVESPPDVSPESLHDLLGSPSLRQLRFHQASSMHPTPLTILLDYFDFSSLLFEVVTKLGWVQINV